MSFLAAARYNGQVTEARLRERLIQIHAIDDSEPYTQQLARDAIVGSKLEGCVCSRVEVAGISRAATFEKFYALLYRVQLDGKPVKAAKAPTLRTENAK